MFTLQEACEGCKEPLYYLSNSSVSLFQNKKLLEKLIFFLPKSTYKQKRHIN